MFFVSSDVKRMLVKVPLQQRDLLLTMNEQPGHDEIELLGIRLSNTLSSTAHVNHLLTVGNQCLFLLSQLKHQRLTLDSLHIIYQALLQAKITLSTTCQRLQVNSHPRTLLALMLNLLELIPVSWNIVRKQCASYVLFINEHLLKCWSSTVNSVAVMALLLTPFLHRC